MNRSKIRVFTVAIFLTVFLWGCERTDSLQLTVIFSESQGVTPGSAVICENLDQQIGQIKEVTIDASTGKALVEVWIESEFKGLIRKGAMFSVSQKPYGNKPSFLNVYIPKSAESNQTVVSGTRLKGVSSTRSWLTRKADDIGPISKEAFRRCQEVVSEVGEFLDSSDGEALKSAIKKTARDLADFTVEQKTYFEKEILPELNLKIEDAIQKYMEKGKEDEAKQLRRELDALKKRLDEK